MRPQMPEEITDARKMSVQVHTRTGAPMATSIHEQRQNLKRAKMMLWLRWQSGLCDKVLDYVLHVCRVRRLSLNFTTGFVNR